ncbi:hypothetical protein PM082_005029 [Marasmius tenuissimus]|nr:hypothetical protein PM082_005029 [Marasmius tenuissimus]
MSPASWDHSSNRDDGQSGQSFFYSWEGQHGRGSDQPPASEDHFCQTSVSQTVPPQVDNSQFLSLQPHDGALDLESSQELRTPFSYYPEHVPQIYSQAYYIPPVSSQPTPPIASTDYLHQYASGSNTPFSFDSYDSPTLPRSPASEAAGPQSVIAPQSPVIIQSTTLEVPSVPSSDANVERPIVGSMANTLVARSLRRREPKYFCDVPGCTSQGFTQKHNLEYHKRSHRNERPYQCDLCFRPFGARSDLNRHIKRGTCRPP